MITEQLGLNDKETNEESKTPVKATGYKSHFCQFCDSDLSRRKLKNSDYLEHVEKCKKYQKYFRINKDHGYSCTFCKQISNHSGQIIGHILKKHAEKLDAEIKTAKNYDEDTFENNIAEDFSEIQKTNVNKHGQVFATKSTANMLFYTSSEDVTTNDLVCKYW